MAMTASREALAAAAPAPPTGLRSTTTHRGFRWLAVATAVTTYLLIAIGGLVRATGSGLGCGPVWPLCDGRWIPPLEHHAIIEYAHRLTVVVVGRFVVALAVVTVVRYRRERPLPLLALAAVVVLAIQGAVGRVVVVSELSAELVGVHLGTAMALVGVLTVLAVRAWSLDRPVTGHPMLVRPGAAAALVVLALILLGAYVRGEGAGLAFPDWPLMEGRLLPDLSSPREVLQFGHRLGAVVVGGVIAWVVVRARREGRGSAAARFAAVALALYLGQVVVGGLNVLTRLAPAFVVLHVALSSLVWGSLVAAAAIAATRDGAEVRT